MPIILVAYILVDNEFSYDKYYMCIFGNCNFGSMVLSNLLKFAYHGEKSAMQYFNPYKLIYA